MLTVSEELSDETLLKLNILLNTHLNGLSLEEINLGMIAAMKQQAVLEKVVHLILLLQKHFLHLLDFPLLLLLHTFFIIFFQSDVDNAKKK